MVVFKDPEGVCHEYYRSESPTVDCSMPRLKSELIRVKSVLYIDERWIKMRIKLLNDGTKLGHYYKKYIWAIVNRQEHITYSFTTTDKRMNPDTKFNEIRCRIR